MRWCIYSQHVVSMHLCESHARAAEIYSAPCPIAVPTPCLPSEKMHYKASATGYAVRHLIMLPVCRVHAHCGVWDVGMWQGALNI